MNCIHCGSTIPEGASICPACGMSRETHQPVSIGYTQECTQELTDESQGAPNSAIPGMYPSGAYAQAPYMQVPYPASGQSQPPTTASKSSGRGWLIAVLAIVLVLGGAAAFVLFWPGVGLARGGAASSEDAISALAEGWVCGEVDTMCHAAYARYDDMSINSQDAIIKECEDFIERYPSSGYGIDGEEYDYYREFFDADYTHEYCMHKLERGYAERTGIDIEITDITFYSVQMMVVEEYQYFADGSYEASSRGHSFDFLCYETGGGWYCIPVSD